MAQAILKNTTQETVVKVWTNSSPGTETITLASLVSNGQVLNGSVNQVVNIVGVTWLGDPAASIQISRGTDIVMLLPCTGANEFDLTGQDVPPDTTGNTEDLSITFANGIAQLYIKLRKVSGYDLTVENATYGAYDDPTRVGASTTLSGSPDKV